MANIDLSLIIPCYNEGPILRDSLNDIFEVLDNTRLSYEIIFVDDYSQDNTKSIIEDIIRDPSDRNVTGIFHQRNKGRGEAVSAGIRAAKGGVVGFIDVDLEVHARYIPSCTLAVKSGFDIAIAYRVYKFHFRSMLRYIMSKGYIFLVRRLIKIDLRDTEAGFKFFNRERILPVVDEINEGGWFWDTEVMIRAFLKGYKIKEVPCLYLRNFKKRSSVNEISDTIYYFKKLFSFKRIMKKEIDR